MCQGQCGGAGASRDDGARAAGSFSLPVGQFQKAFPPAGREVQGPARTPPLCSPMCGPRGPFAVRCVVLGFVRGQVHAFICLVNKKNGLIGPSTPGQCRSTRAICTRWVHFYVHFPRFGRFSGAERTQRRARARNRAKRVRGGMGVNSPSMKTNRATRGLGWCIETRVRIPAFVLWARR